MSNLDQPEECLHESVIPVFDSEAARGLPSAEVRKRWPRFVGTCPDCGSKGIVYASFLHFVMGDW